MTWLRLQADFFQDPKIIRLTREAGPLGPLVFIALLTIAKRGGRDADGCFDVDDLDPYVIASYMHVRAPEDEVSRAVTACHSVGLLVTRDGGKSALRSWKKYHPDSTATERKRRQRAREADKRKSGKSGSVASPKKKASRDVTGRHCDVTQTRQDETRRDEREDFQSSPLSRHSDDALRSGSGSAGGLTSASRVEEKPDRSKYLAISPPARAHIEEAVAALERENQAAYDYATQALGRMGYTRPQIDEEVTQSRLGLIASRNGSAT